MTPDVTEAKRVLRLQLLANRAARAAAERDAANRQIATRITARLAGMVIAAYVPVADEPGRIEHLSLLRSCGVRILLPITLGRGDPLSWGWYDKPEALVAGPFGLRQPAVAAEGHTPHDADLVIVPALALNPAGARLGRGGGFYDRVLLGVPRARMIGLVYDDELRGELPTEPHDIEVGWIFTPSDLRRAVRRE